MTRIVTAAARNAAKSSKHEMGEVPESESLEERERRTLEDVTELEAEVRVSQLEDRLEQLCEERCKRRTRDD